MYILQKVTDYKNTAGFFELFDLIRLNGINEALIVQSYINIPEYLQITHAPTGLAIGHAYVIIGSFLTEEI